MRKIQDLLDAGYRVWFYLRDQETENRFVEEINEIGATYLNGSQVTMENCSPIMAVHADRKVGHLMIMIWNASFQKGFANHYKGDLSKTIKVDYAKYISGDDNYICTQSEFIPVLRV